DPGQRAILIQQFLGAANSNITVSNNTITVDAGSLNSAFSTTPALIEVSGGLTGANSITANSIVLSAALAAGIDAVYGIEVHGQSGFVGQLDVTANTLTGGNVGGAGTAGMPPTSGLFVDPDSLTASLDLDVENNFINGWVNGVSV